MSYSELIGHADITINKNEAEISIQRYIRVDRNEGETDQELKSRTVAEAYKSMQFMQKHFKKQSKQAGFPIK